MQTDLSTLIVLITAGISVWAFQDRRVMSKLLLSPYAVVRSGQWYRVITHAFVHADWMHLLFNMIALWSFGRVVLIYFSHITESPNMHFIIMYVVAIVAASVHDLIKQKDNPHFLSLGASGAVSAVVFAAILFDPWSTVLIFFIPCPAILFGVAYILYSSYMGRKEGERVNHNAHLYGAIFGLIYPMLVNPQTIQIFFYSLSHPRFFS